MPQSTYYYYIKQMKKPDKYAAIKEQIRAILKRDFIVTAPNQKWTTDITESAMFGTKLYLSLILDMYNGEIISYEISDRPVILSWKISLGC